MPDMLVRNIKPETMAFLKSKAAARGHTVQDEVRELFDELARNDWNARLESQRRAAELRDRLRATGADFGDSTADTRADRDSDHGRA